MRTLLALLLWLVKVAVGLFVGLGLVVVFVVLVMDDGGESSDEPTPRPAPLETTGEPVTPAEESPAEGNNQEGVQFGYACSPVGSLGVAGGGRPAECFMGKDGRARWGYDSDRG
ncbi:MULTISPECIES: hypothetical protein [Streptomyces]|uniref:hypothetical protein n=1 Tax=Streptomyces TaxID=1883 RepID=UPI001672285B|nr:MULTISPECIES: hypothetical protein [Streptomyces]WGP08846.1 hypothetical protein QFA72_03745 [Streptomyces sp. SH5]GGP66867.1 hypothetical protein GCM10010231_42140 [Streptomyces sindenensis]